MEEDNVNTLSFRVAKLLVLQEGTSGMLVDKINHT